MTSAWNYKPIPIDEKIEEFKQFMIREVHESIHRVQSPVKKEFEETLSYIFNEIWLVRDLYEYWHSSEALDRIIAKPVEERTLFIAKNHNPIEEMVWNNCQVNYLMILFRILLHKNILNKYGRRSTYTSTGILKIGRLISTDDCLYHIRHDYLEVDHRELMTLNSIIKRVYDIHTSTVGLCKPLFDDWTSKIL